METFIKNLANSLVQNNNQQAIKSFVQLNSRKDVLSVIGYLEKTHPDISSSLKQTLLFNELTTNRQLGMGFLAFRR